MSYEETVAEIGVLIDDIAALLPGEGVEPSELEAKVAQLLAMQSALMEMLASAETEATAEGEPVASETEDIGEPMS